MSARASSPALHSSDRSQSWLSMTSSKGPDGENSCVDVGPSVFQDAMQSLISDVLTCANPAPRVEAPSSDPCLIPVLRCFGNVLRRRRRADFDPSVHVALSKIHASCHFNPGFLGSKKRVTLRCINLSNFISRGLLARCLQSWLYVMYVIIVESCLIHRLRSPAARSAAANVQISSRVHWTRNPLDLTLSSQMRT